MMKRLRNKKGFTLIELIVVIAILGILAIIAIPRLAGFQEDSRQRADISNGRTIAGIISVMVANSNITADVTTALVTSDANIVANLPNLVPAVQTTAVNTGDFHYSVDVGTGVVTVWAADDAAACTDANEVFPTPGSTFTN